MLTSKTVFMASCDVNECPSMGYEEDALEISIASAFACSHKRFSSAACSSNCRLASAQMCSCSTLSKLNNAPQVSHL